MRDTKDPDPLQTAARAAADKKAFQIVGLEVGDLTSYTDSLLICSGASDRQVAAIADEVQRQLKDAGRRPLHVTGFSSTTVNSWSTFSPRSGARITGSTGCGGTPRSSRLTPSA